MRRIFGKLRLLLFAFAMMISSSFCVQAENEENMFLKEILDDTKYVCVELGGAYAGEKILYDITGERTIAYPNENEHRQVFRNKKKATVFYGKYRGKEVYKNYKTMFPELHIDYFFEPLKSLEFTMQDIQEHGYQMELEQPEQLEEFMTPLSFMGVLDDEIFSISKIHLSFDTACRPIEIKFVLNSDVADPERIAFVEEEIRQQFAYMDRESFERAYDTLEREIEKIVPAEKVKVEEYVSELSNVRKVAEEELLEQLMEHTELQKNVAGWDKKAIFAYLDAVDFKFGNFVHGYERTQITQEEYIDQLGRIYETSRLVGSDVYSYMFDCCEMKPKEKALLVIKQMGGKLDKNGMLQLQGGYQFYPGMEPHSEFLESYAQCVRDAYVRKDKSYKRLDDTKIHQFRMYIDRHNIEYVRLNFDGKTDYEKLKQYAKVFDIKLYYGEPSRHHNKIQKKERFSTQKCDKILTPNRLSEFIVNVETGKFVTQWDVLQNKNERVESKTKTYQDEKKSRQAKVVNTESFNYAPADYVVAHQKLDVLPASPVKNKKYYLENDVKKMLKEIWKSPDKVRYKEKYRKPSDYVK